jgi:hypothetical protein
MTMSVSTRSGASECHLKTVGLQQNLEALANDGLIVDDEHRER